MGMQLRVELAAGVLPEHTNHDPFGIDTHHMPLSPHPSVSLRFHPGEHGVHRCVVCRRHLPAGLLVADGEQHRHRLRCRERGVEPPHRPVAVAATQRSTGGRMLPRHHRQKRIAIDVPFETEKGGTSPVPAARWLTRIQVVGGELLGVVAASLSAFERGHPHRHDATSTLSPQMCTLLSLLLRRGRCWLEGVVMIRIPGGLRILTTMIHLKQRYQHVTIDN